MKSKIENNAVVLTAETDAEETVLLHLWLDRARAVEYDRPGQLVIAPTLREDE